MPESMKRLTGSGIAKCIKPLLGMKISKIWRSVEPCIFLELGNLKRCTKTKTYQGQVSLSIESDWRYEERNAICFGSGFSKTKIDKGLKSLLNKKISSIQLRGNIPELCLGIDNNKRIITFNDYSESPMWTISINNLNEWDKIAQHYKIKGVPFIGVDDGTVTITDCYD